MQKLNYLGAHGLLAGLLGWAEERNGCPWTPNLAKKAGPRREISKKNQRAGQAAKLSTDHTSGIH